MKTGQTLSLIDTIIMGFSIVYGFTMGDFTFNMMIVTLIQDR